MFHVYLYIYVKKKRYMSGEGRIPESLVREEGNRDKMRTKMRKRAIAYEKRLERERYGQGDVGKKSWKGEKGEG